RKRSRFLRFRRRADPDGEQTGFLRRTGVGMAQVRTSRSVLSSRHVLLLAAAAVALRASLAVAQTPAFPPVNPNKIPDFSGDDVSWLSYGNEYIPMETGPHPVTPDPAHPYIQSGRGGRQPTLRVADLNNPILQPWVKDELR